ncbi:MAG: MASE1 domain-containing protein [Chloroflexota bacterium]
MPPELKLTQLRFADSSASVKADRWAAIASRGHVRVALLLLFSVAYVLAAGFGQGLAIIPGVSITFWPPAGIFVASLLLSPQASWPRWVLAGCLAELTCNVIWFHNPLHLALVYFAANALEALTAAWLLNRVLGRPLRLATLEEVAAFVLLAAGIAPTVGATVIAATDAIIGKHPFATAWTLVWLGDSTGLLVSTPLALGVVQTWRERASIPSRRILEAAVLTLLLLAGSVLSATGYLPTAYVTLPPLLWAAARFQLLGAATALGFVTLMTAAYTVTGEGEFAGPPELMQYKIVMLKTFLGISAVSALAVAALSQQRVLAMLSLQETNAALEARVADRTAALESLNATLERRVVDAVAERETAEAHLRQAQKMEAVGRLTGGVAHDFNNLLTVVIGNLALLRRRVEGLDDPRLMRLVDNAMDGAKRGAQLNHRLLAFSRQQPLQPKVVDANELVEGMLDLLRRTQGEDIAIETVLADGLWRAEVDPNQLENSVLNLAVNACDAMPDGGKLTIRTANVQLNEASEASTNGEIKGGQYILVSVSDTGSGMSPEVQASAFEPFFTTKPVGKGTGLGLAQVYGFMRQSGGHTTIDSELGQGTTVELYFPRLKPSEELVRAESTVDRAAGLSPTIPAGAGELILVLEDEPMVRDLSVSVLEDAGYRVLAASDGLSALTLLREHAGDVRLLFTDVVLTGTMNGREVSEEAVKICPTIKVLFTTGYTRDTKIISGRLNDEVALIRKPFETADLLARVHQIFHGA